MISTAMFIGYILVFMLCFPMTPEEEKVCVCVCDVLRCVAEHQHKIHPRCNCFLLRYLGSPTR